MAVQVVKIPALDPNTFTGPTRTMAGVARTGDVVLDNNYGPNNSPEYARWLYVGVQGDVSYTKWDGTEQRLKDVVAGVWHPIYSMKVNSLGTTATDIVWGS